MILYHATEMKNLDSIMEKGILRSKFEGVVYLAETPRDAAKFLAIRMIKNILVAEVNVEEYLVQESFDHSEKVFQCKAYTYPQDIPPESILEYTQFKL